MGNSFLEINDDICQYLNDDIMKVRFWRYDLNRNRIFLSNINYYRNYVF